MAGTKLKITVLILTILILSLWTSLGFKFVDWVSIDSFKITEAGWWFIGGVSVLIGVNGWLIIWEDKQTTSENLELKSKLKDIHEALENSGLKYDSVNKTIININAIVVHGHQQAAVIMNPGVRHALVRDNVAHFHNHPSRPSLKHSTLLLDQIQELAKAHNIIDKSVWLVATKDTNGGLLFPLVRKMLTDNGYTISREIVNLDERFNEYYKNDINVGYFLADDKEPKRIFVVCGNIQN